MSTGGGAAEVAAVALSTGAGVCTLVGGAVLDAGALLVFACDREAALDAGTEGGRTTSFSSARAAEATSTVAGDGFGAAAGAGAGDGGGAKDA
jgi:hypothetical protein